MSLTEKEAMELAEKHMDAFDILINDGVPEDNAAAFILATLHGDKDPKEQALHFVMLRKVFRGDI